jgi:hypothetical protein
MRQTPPEPPVHIDSSNDAWLCFTWQRSAEHQTVERERWQAFTTQIAARFAAWIGDQHDTLALAAVLSETLASNPGVAVGVTWDGGIAITYADYRAAERRLAQALAQGAARPPWR